jgi:hypothetical protein
MLPISRPDAPPSPAVSRRRSIIGVAAIGALLLAPAAALSHHGWGSFDASKALDHTGPVVASIYANPHGVLTMERNGRRLTIELAPVFRMQARGLSEADIAPGKVVRVLAYENTRDATLFRAEWVEVAGRRVELR